MATCAECSRKSIPSTTIFMSPGMTIIARLRPAIRQQANFWTSILLKVIYLHFRARVLRTACHSPTSHLLQSLGLSRVAQKRRAPPPPPFPLNRIPLPALHSLLDLSCGKRVGLQPRLKRRESEMDHVFFDLGCFTTVMDFSGRLQPEYDDMQGALIGPTASLVLESNRHVTGPPAVGVQGGRGLR